MGGFESSELTFVVDVNHEQASTGDDSQPIRGILVEETEGLLLVGGCSVRPVRKPRCRPLASLRVARLQAAQGDSPQAELRVAHGCGDSG